jgi:hypothetical protein
MNALLAAGSLAGVIGLALTAKWLGLGAARLADEGEACAIAEAELPGFVAARAELDPDGQAAIVTGIDGAAVRLRRHGANFVAEPASG